MYSSDFGGVLVWKTIEGHWLPVEYMSHHFLSPELNYGVTKRDLLVVLLGLKRWCHYLLVF